jgi:hypothetical protein
LTGISQRLDTGMADSHVMLPAAKNQLEIRRINDPGKQA